MVFSHKQSKESEQIFGYIERLTFHNPENGFTVAQLKMPKRLELICLVGAMPGIQPGETVRCFGTWKHHLVHGRQFEVEKFRTEAPADVEGIRKYLGSGLIKGIGPAYAKKITDTFREETLSIIDTNPRQLEKIPGIGKKRVEMIQKCWDTQKSIREVMIFLQSYGISPTFAQKIFKIYGNKSVATIQENPFLLAREVVGIGFKTADTIAQKMGIEKDSPVRIDAGIEYLLSEFSKEGHVCYPEEEFIQKTEPVLEVTKTQILERIEALKKEDRIKGAELFESEDPIAFIWLKKLFLSEMGIVYEFRRLKREVSLLRQIETDKAIKWAQEKKKIQLAPKQKLAIANCLMDKIHVITGGPGTGKSTIINLLLTITSFLTDKIILAAPTGRAAKRMSEITGRKASTIHSLLEFDFRQGGFKRNRENPLECDLIIVDESSMIDTMLMFQLLRAIPSHARVVLVGDIHQLPSVGPGNVLKDIIQGAKIGVTRLTDIFRQAAGSKIITNAHRINDGIFPDIENNQESDFFFMEVENPEEVLQTITTLVTKRIPKRYGYHPLKEIQVLSPMRRGIIGIDQLNIHLQQALNKRDNPLIRSGRSFLVGDKVMQIRNNYKKEVFNGDIGTISEIDLMSQALTVLFDDKAVEYEFNEIDELVLAYAVSIHKYQGSECPAIVIPIHTTHFMMLHRNLLYTGVTRGKKLVILVGTKKALAIAVKNNEVLKRHTGLEHALKGRIRE